MSDLDGLREALIPLKTYIDRLFNLQHSTLEDVQLFTTASNKVNDVKKQLADL